MKIANNQFLIYTFFAAFLIGSSYNTYVHYNFEHTTIDCRAYINVANGDFKSATVTHRYRVIVPILAKAVSFPISLVYKKLWPHRADKDWPLKLAFMIINVSIMSLAMLLLYQWLQRFNINNYIALITCVALFSGRWYNYMAALPLTDSLYLLIVILTCFAITSKNWKITLLCIFIGPWAKESFLFLAPLLFFFGAHKWRQIPFWLASGALVFGFRYIIDLSIHYSALGSIQEYGGHFNDIVYTFKKLASVRGLGELFSVLGIFTFAIIWAISKIEIRKSIPNALLWLLLIFFFHAFLSGEAARMFSFAAPLWAFLLAKAFTALQARFLIFNQSI